jgi:hypothetical protein
MVGCHADRDQGPIAPGAGRLGRQAPGIQLQVTHLLTGLAAIAKPGSERNGLGSGSLDGRHVDHRPPVVARRDSPRQREPVRVGRLLCFSQLNRQRGEPSIRLCAAAIEKKCVAKSDSQRSWQL